MKRLFTFGCSFTNYLWPTWADFVGSRFNVFQNWGQPGAGNSYILGKMIECNQIEKLTKDDVVLVMFTSTNRFDYIGSDLHFRTIGNIYCEEAYKRIGEHFINNVWSIEHGIYNTWVAISSVKSILDNVGCQYKLMLGFASGKIDHYHELINIQENDLRTNFCLNQINDMIGTTVNLNNFCHVNYDFHDKVYVFNEVKDYHPTITIHHDWVKNQMGEYYHEDMEILCKNWEGRMSTIKKQIPGIYNKDIEKKYGIEYEDVKKKLI